MSNANPLFNSLQEFDLGTGQKGRFYSLPALEAAGLGPILEASRLHPARPGIRPAQLRRQESDRSRTSAPWPTGSPRRSARRKSRSSWRGSFCRTSPACRCWWISRRCVPPWRAWGRTPKSSNRSCRWIWSWTIRCRSISSATADALRQNLEMEFMRNRERYQFLKWGMQAFDTFKVVPPGIGIVHQVNLEYPRQRRSLRVNSN